MHYYYYYYYYYYDSRLLLLLLLLLRRRRLLLLLLLLLRLLCLNKLGVLEAARATHEAVWLDPVRDAHEQHARLYACAEQAAQVQHAVAGPQRRETARLVRHVLVALEHRHTQHRRRRLLRGAVERTSKHIMEAVPVCDAACDRMWSRLQPYVMEAPARGSEQFRRSWG